MISRKLLLSPLQMYIIWCFKHHNQGFIVFSIFEKADISGAYVSFI